MTDLSRMRLEAAHHAVSIGEACEKSRKHLKELLRELQIPQEHHAMMLDALDRYEASMYRFAEICVQLAAGDVGPPPYLADQLRGKGLHFRPDPAPVAGQDSQ